MKDVRSLSLKVCGNRDNILEVAALKPDYMGFIFYEQSPRYVGLDFLMPTFSSDIKKVGVFVNERLPVIEKKVFDYKLDFVQLHGSESVFDCKSLKQSGVGVIKVFAIDEFFDFTTTSYYEEAVDYFLFDTKGKFYGGNAVAFDWRLLKRYSQRVPFFLGGGLSVQNVVKVKELSRMNLVAIDVNSGVEDSPGVKNTSKIVALQNILNPKS